MRTTWTTLLAALLLVAGTAAAQQIDTGSITAGGADCSTAKRCVSIALPPQTVSTTIQVSGTYSGTLQFEASADGGTTWFSALAIKLADGSSATSTTSTGLFAIANGGLTNVRVRCSAYSSGTASITAVRGYATAKWLTPFVTALYVGSGSAAAPSYSYAADQTTGEYLVSAGDIGVSVGGTKELDISSAGLAVNHDVTLSAASTLGWSTDLKLIHDGANILGLKNGTAAQKLRIYGDGTKHLSLSHDGTNAVIDTAASSGAISIAPTNATSVTVGKPILATDGTAAAPSYSFTSQPSYGMFFNAGIGLGFSAGNDESLALLNGSGPVVAGGRSLGFATDASFGSRDLFIGRDGPNTFFQRNGVNAQAYNIYGYSSGARALYEHIATVTTAVTLAGASTGTGNVIPAGATVVDVATTTTTTITGATGYQVGDGVTATRYGDITGTAVGTASGSTNYTADPRWWSSAARAITLTAKTSNFTGGVVQVTVFYLSAVGS